MKIVLLMLAIVLICSFTISTPAVAYEACDRAADAGWYHPGFNNACMMSIMYDLFGYGWDNW